MVVGGVAFGREMLKRLFGRDIPMPINRAMRWFLVWMWRRGNARFEMVERRELCEKGSWRWRWLTSQGCHIVRMTCKTRGFCLASL
jgi:hypothetical protein